MDASRIDRAVALIAEARVQGRPLGPLPEECRPADEAEAYAIQDALHRWQEAQGMGGLAGHKIGLTNPAMRELLGIDSPGAGGMLASGIHHQRAVFPCSRFTRVGVECEVAVRMAAGTSAAGAPYSRQGIAEIVSACMVAAEIVDERYEDYRALGLPTLLADDLYHAAAVLGPPVEDWRDIDLAAVTAITEVDGAEAGRGLGADIMGHPFAAVAWLADNLASRGLALKAGDIVLTGTMPMVQWIEGPAEVRCTVSGLGRVEVTFEEG